MGFSLILALGLYLSIKARLSHILAFSKIARTFFEFITLKKNNSLGEHPLLLFFTSVGGMIGIGNIIGIITAVRLGGPGALFWVWIAGFLGMLIKYCDVFLGLRYRVANERGSFDGGPMFYLRHAFKNKSISFFVAALLCIYGIEVYQFSVVTDSVTNNWQINRYLVISILVLLIVFGASGGIRRLIRICAIMMPILMGFYLFMSLWVIFHHVNDLPFVFTTVLKSAFSGHAAVGGFAGSSVILAIQQGISRAAYSADIGIGYDSILQSESIVNSPAKQACLAMFGLCIDNFICTLSILLVLVTGVWNLDSSFLSSDLIQMALSEAFPAMDVYMPLFLLITGYTTIMAYFCMGTKCATFLFPKLGKKCYLFLGAFMLVTFTFFEQTYALLIMSLSGSLILLINFIGIFRLRDAVSFQVHD